MVQTRTRLSPDENLKEIGQLIREAAGKGADYVQTPEMTNILAANRDSLFKVIADEDSDKSLAAYHMFEYASAAFQLAIVLAGAAALTTVMWLTFVSVGLGVVGAAFTILAFVAPTLIHL